MEIGSSFQPLRHAEPLHLHGRRNREASRILKIDQEGKVVGVLSGPEPGKGRHFDPHEIAVGKDNSIFTAEVMPWRAQKFKPK
jgi:hypothetical protein